MAWVLGALRSVPPAPWAVRGAELRTLPTPRTNCQRLPLHCPTNKVSVRTHARPDCWQSPLDTTASLRFFSDGRKLHRRPKGPSASCSWRAKSYLETCPDADSSGGFEDEFRQLSQLGESSPRGLFRRRSPTPTPKRP